MAGTPYVKNFTICSCFSLSTSFVLWLGVGPEPEWKLPSWWLCQDHRDLITTPRNDFKGKVGDKFSHTNMRFYPLILYLLIVPQNLGLLSPFPEVKYHCFSCLKDTAHTCLFKEDFPEPHH